MMKLLKILNLFSLSLLPLSVNGFVSKTPRKYEVLRQSPTRYLNTQLFDSSDDDVRLIDDDEASELLKIWEKSSTFKNNDIIKMRKIADRGNVEDVFVSYSPIHNKNRKIRYLFYGRLVLEDSPKLYICLGARSPFDKSNLSSYHFRKVLEEQLPIIPIDWTPITNTPRFKLSWKWHEMDMEDNDGDDDDNWDGYGMN